MPQQLGRFQIHKVLSAAPTCSVFLANDPGLQREVEIRVMRLPRGAVRHSLLDSARASAKLRHPNLVAVLEVGEEADSVYLVFDHVPGSSLAQALRDRGALEPRRVIEILLAVLDALQHAHQAGVVHAQLSPLTVQLDSAGEPRLSNCGLALPPEAGEGALGAAPSYVAPEVIAGAPPKVAADIYAAGLLLYQMLFGRPAFEAASEFELVHRIANEPLVFPADAFERSDEVMIDIIAKATARDPSLRYASAAQMQQALREAAQPVPVEGRAARRSESSGTLDFLLRRMRHHSDFPSMSVAMTAVNRLAQSEQGDASRLSALILKDFALTNKLLRVANSAHYNGGRGGTVSTVSRAIIVLGFDAVRSIALSLLLFEHLQDKKHAETLKEEFLRATIAGALARELGAVLGGAGQEEYFVCAIFHNLGRLVAQYYLRQEALAVQKLREHDGSSEDLASRRVLGVSFNELGIGVARSWGFPDAILHSMERAPPPRSAPTALPERLRLVSTAAVDLCDLIEREPAQSLPSLLAGRMRPYAAALPVEDQPLRALVDRAIESAAELASLLQLDLRSSALGRRLAPEAGATATAGGGSAAIAQPTLGAALDAKAVLAAGIQDISQGLLEELPMADLMRGLVETAYRAFGFRRVLLCLRDERDHSLVARFALGPDADVPWDRFRVAPGGKDLFGLSLGRNADVLIHDASEAKVRDRLPRWYLEHFYARAFLLMPMRRADSVVGLMYADQDSEAGIQIGDSEFALLKALRNQAVLVLKSSW